MLIFKKYRWLCLLLTISVLFSNCQVYQKVPVTLEEASVSNQRVRIITTDKQKLLYKSIIKTDSTYFGLEESGSNIIQKPIKTEEIQRIQIINKPKSRLVSIAAGTVFAGLLIFLIGSNVTTGAGAVGGF
ncbi:hypothetical protein [Flavobacterium sp.]|uniref:hypothetical protein n=1 Tax=Flavobacterium sp. TaxID=239 RepID=UPI0028BD3736|nr:hypothetical protein [Flavobacterium sp.]